MKPAIICFLFAFTAFGCNNNPQPVSSEQPATTNAASDSSRSPSVDSLPAPFASKSVSNFSRVTGWPAGKTPLAPAGFTVTKFAAGLNNPRWIYQAPNGDIFVAESNTIVKGVKKIGAKISGKMSSMGSGSSANRVTLLRDHNKDGVYETQLAFASNLNQPLGMLIMNGHFYIANTDALVQYDYTTGDSILKGPGKTILSLPGGGYNNHWTRNIIAGKKQDKIFISVGSGSNVAEHGLENEKRRANILEVNPDGSGERIYASGLRNPVGMDWDETTGRLWTAVNERDGLGDDLVPDYITSVQEGGFYGWPYVYFGQHEDPRMKEQPKPAQVGASIVPDLAVGAHTASLGFTFYKKTLFPERYRQGAFIGQHGSWNRSALSGYKVMFVPFSNGKPAGKAEDFLTGFIADASNMKVHGRPVGVTVLQDGSLLVADDVANTIWQVGVAR